ncbi:ABC transporter substrate-binding protein [Niveispirillum sp.]|uniref:substrate-binding periplasmic protein n=1 Tax=Niveispirillum sp. TaxID=1917217 RepID=UPI001B6B011C|nr:transporter substrate-binding domain-containing protein [Niveispirillum sp.]MBP7340270.1 transporter substrate-binding domain-containing protein [Niveispirillum sp.]
MTRSICRPWLLLPAALAAVLLLPAPDAGAQETGTPVSTATPSVVSVVCGPLPFVSDGGACDRGIGAELAHAACDRAGLKCAFQQLPWPRAQKEVEMRQADILIGPFHTPERDAWLDFSREHFYVDQMWLFRHPPDDGRMPDEASISTIGVPLGWAVGGDLDRRPGVRLETVRTVDLALNLVLSGRLDAVAAHARAVARYHDEHPGIRLLPVGRPLSVQRSYMGFSKLFAGTLERRLFEAAYESLLADSQYGEILARNKPFPDMRTEVATRGHQFPSAP